MVLRNATKNEAQIILSLYSAVISTPFCTWSSQYPSELEISQDMAAQTLFVLEENAEIIGAGSIVPENELDELECWKLRGKVAEIARIAVRPDLMGKGLSSILVTLLLEKVKERGFTAVHLSVAKKNLPAQALYKKLGFETVGDGEMFGGSYYFCEKVL